MINWAENNLYGFAKPEKLYPDDFEWVQDLSKVNEYFTMIKNRWLKSGKNLYVTYKIKKCSLNLKIKAKGRLQQNMKKRYAFKNQIN